MPCAPDERVRGLGDRSLAIDDRAARLQRACGKVHDFH